MQSDTNDRASPRHTARRQQNKPHRGNGVTQHADVLSDSNFPAASTPRPRKAPGNSGVVHSHAHPATTGKGRPASAAAANGNLATPSKPSYAGAAFHASPAPSSLPVPKFFSKSVPVVDAQSGLQARLERDGDKSDSNDGAHTPVPFPGLSATKSPLDMFFTADREEKAKKIPTLGTETSQVAGSQTPSRSREMFMLELDDTSSPVNSKAGTPALNRQKSAPGHVQQSQSPDEARRAAQTQSLKSFLNITASSAGNGLPASPARSLHTPNGQQQPNHNLATPVRHDDHHHYGNRNLSPLFQAATRSPLPPVSPHNSDPQLSTPDRSHVNQQYMSAHASQYAASPSRSPLPPAPQPYQQYPQQQQQQPYQSHATSNGASDMRSMEERMKKMLNMG